MLYTVFSNAQKWCPPGAEWRYNIYSWGGIGVIKYVIEKDTLVHQKACKKISGKRIIKKNVSPGYPQKFDSLSLDPIYTYIANDTVYFFYEKSFRPAFYFNAKVGDTLNYYDGPLCDTVIQQIVDSTGQVTINNHTLRFYRVKNGKNNGYVYPFSLTVIERIGVVDNNIIPFFPCFTDAPDYDLRCYQDNDFGIYKTNPLLKCDLDVSNTLEVFENEITISPNPAHSILNIYAEYPDQLKSIIIYNIEGKLLAKYEKTSLNSLHSVDISSLSNGSYLIKLENTIGQVATKKFIKLDVK